MEYLLIYLLQVADNLETIQITSCVILAIILFTFIMMSCTTKWQFEEYKAENRWDMSTDVGQNFWKYSRTKIKKSIVICFLLLLITSIIPTKQTLILMSGVYYGKQIIKSEKVQKVNSIIDLELDKILKDLKQNIKQ